MQYKTITLELLQMQTELHERLRSTGRLPSMLDYYAQQLQNNHEVWKETLSQVKPDNDLSQINSRALELAIDELEGRLRFSSPQDDGGVMTLDNIMAYLIGHMSRN